MYKVIRYFEDMQDGMHPYNVGDTFPRDGVDANDDRLAELATGANLQRTPLIEYVEDEAPVKKARKKKKDAD